MSPVEAAAPEAVLITSAERDLWLRRLLAAELAAWRAGYTAGCADERRAADRAWAAQSPSKASDGPDLAELDLKRWGHGGREHFTDPREGDGHATKARRDAYASGLVPAGKIHLGGRMVHGHHSPCIPACSAYRPGWYSYRDAARIMATLPDCPNYREEIAELERLADEYAAVAA